MSARERRHRRRDRTGTARRNRGFPQPDQQELERENERLKHRIEELEKKIVDLERQLALRRQNSTTSSKPPSSDGLAGEPRKRGRRKKSWRKPGGQEGHPGAHRPLVPPEKVAEFHDVLPAQCDNCHRPLAQQLEQVQTVGEVHRHQVTELPPIEARVIEWRCHRVLCENCGESTRAAVPLEARPQSGPQLTALIAYLTVVCRMPRRVAQTLLEQVLKTPISLGSTQKSWEEASDAVEAPCQELEGQLQNEPVLNIDETGWRTNGAKRYLWAFVAAGFVVYTLAKTRGSEQLIRILGAVFSGILCSDRFSAYLKYHKGTAQFCWAHLKRNILGILDLAKNSGTERFCRDALALHARLFRLWHKYRGGQIGRSQLILRSIPLQKRFFALAERHLDSPDRQVQNLATAMFDHCQRLFAFLEFENVDPTNNSAERALRTGVQWRKVCFGTRSDAGERATARLLTVTETCNKQHRNSLLYLTEAIMCHRRHQPAPSLWMRPM
jgi:transposase